jgi:acyl-[acyl-carrier-protein]-phospholipid O-acyltransferase/long-chain-fatty-acid--[acyl-carrier-protein] ligase
MFPVTLEELIPADHMWHEIAGRTEQAFAVTSVPDEKKGERLIVLHMLSETELADVLSKFAESDLPPLWKPRPNQFFHVDALPYLGTGKMDLQGLKKLAADLSRRSGTAALV